MPLFLSRVTPKYGLMYTFENSADSRTRKRELPIRTPVVEPALLHIEAHDMFSLQFFKNYFHYLIFNYYF